jgi:type II secretory ATPase GspE/PulE/Tfp pilus assembly ATPase PilB-like protein/DNA-binding response OmpR family regulator
MSGPDRKDGARALLRFLARQGRLGNEDVARVEEMLADGTLTVHDALEREGLLSQKELALLLAETLRLKIVDLTTYPLDANVTRLLKEAIAARYEVVPIAVHERTIEVATANPLDLDGLKAVEFATGKRVQAVVATHVEVKDALAHTYRLQESLEQFLQLVPAGESLVVNELEDEGADLRTIAADAELPPVIKLADKMLIEGIKSRASDIHVEPEGDSVLVRYRVDGILEEAFRFPKWIQNPLVARLKVMAKLDITERRLPQDGRIQVRFNDKSVDMRVSSLPAQHGEKITLRILDASQAVKALDRLGFGAPDLKILRDAAKKPQGMILITGPTGSGKTTTLYALLREIFSPKTNIVTIENPIEYQLKGINQVEVNEKQGLTFGGVLRSVLRQDPDVILLGEIRDKETAQIAFQAATTGHLVLSTVHTNDAAGAITRLVDLGLEPYAIAAALNLVVAQRLVRQLCPTCSQPAEVDPELRRQLHLDDAAVKGPAGCTQCRHAGYRSRIGVYEMLPMSPAVTKLVEAGAGETMVRQQVRSEGYHTLLEDAVEKVRGGLTAVEELQRVVQIADVTGTRCPGCQKEIAEDYSVCPHCSKVLRSSCGGCAKPLNPEWVRCPYCGSAAVPDEAPATAAAPAERRSFKALVVDDTATIRDVVRHTLEHSDLGLTVLTAEDGPQALDIAGRERPDIVILDISMPGMDGFEVCRRLRSEMRTAFVPVLMLTAHDSEDDVARGFGVGADDYMVKPFRREGLVARVRRILERTYGSQAVGAPPLPDPPAAPLVAEETPSSYALTPDSEVTTALAALAADRDALRVAIEGCEARLGELAARPIPAGPIAPVLDADGLAELRQAIAELRAQQERGLAELREETARVRRVAEDALKHATGAVAAVPSAQLATMMGTVERLQGEQARLASTLAAMSSEEGGADEECERRLRQATQEIEGMRAGVAELREGWQREAGAIRAEVRASADEAWQRAQAEASGVAAQLTATVDELRTAVEEERGARARDGARMRTVEERAGRLEGEALAAVDKTARELASLQRGVAEQQELRAQDAQRLAEAEEIARHARTEMLAAAEQLTGELAALRRSIAEQRDGASLVATRIDGAEEAARLARNETAATASRLGEALDALAARTEADLAEVRRALAAHAENVHPSGEQTEAADAVWQRVQQEAVAAAEAAARSVQIEATAGTERTARELAVLRETMEAWHGEERAEIASVRGRLDQARRAVVKIARRVRAAGTAVEAHVEAREAECEEAIQAVRAETSSELQKLRAAHGDLLHDVAESLRDLPSAAEQRTVRASLDGCETRLMELANRLEAQGTTRATVDDEARVRVDGELRELHATLARLEGEHRRHAADVEERLRGLMRTAAGGFDVQLALLRGKVEVLARTLRERVPVDEQAPTDDSLLQHRHGLLERLREQLTALQSGSEWRPQRVVDLLVESTLAAAVTPFRRVLHLALGEEDAPKAIAGGEAGSEGREATRPTDESTSPS